MRNGAYEVRLFESPHACPDSTFLFWIELFDHNRQVSIDSGGSDVLEDAVVAAEHLIALAMRRGEYPPSSVAANGRDDLPSR